MKNKEYIDIFTDRRTNDRRKSQGLVDGQERRKNDRRKMQFKSKSWWLQADYLDGGSKEN